MGILIVVEGIDGAGKTTQVQLLGDGLRKAGEDPVLSKEPTNGHWGRKLRESAQNGRLPLAEELDAFIRDRRDHAKNMILPALAADQIVILDRYFYSTIAYQSIRGADREELRAMMQEFPRPDVVFLLDADPWVTLARITNGRQEKPNEFERHDDLLAVREVFNWLADVDIAVCKIDAHQTIQNVHREIVSTLVDGALTKLRRKPYDCGDCWPALCTFGATDTCRWLKIQSVLHASLRTIG